MPGRGGDLPGVRLKSMGLRACVFLGPHTAHSAHKPFPPAEFIPRHSLCNIPLLSFPRRAIEIPIT